MSLNVAKYHFENDSNVHVLIQLMVLLRARDAGVALHG
jgi:hypothetical protein